MFSAQKFADIFIAHLDCCIYSGYENKWKIAWLFLLIHVSSTFYHFNDVFDLFTVTISRAEIFDKFKETDFIPLDFTLVSQFTRARQEHFCNDSLWI